MKKATRILLAALTVTVTLLTSLVPGAAKFYPANEDEKCQNGEVTLEIGYTEEAPVMDGVVNKNEYTRIPNEMLVDFYTYNVGEQLNGVTDDEMYEYLQGYVQNDMEVYANWDSQYFYFALVAGAPSTEYTCPKEADSVNMFRYWCLQCGFAAPDATGEDRFEIGLGAPSDIDYLDDCYCFDAWGKRFFKSFKKGTDYYANWDVSEFRVTYELRVSIGEVTGKNPSNGSTMRFLYLLSQSGQNGLNGGDHIQIQSSYGCARGKNVQQYLTLTFVGMPESVTVNEDETFAIEDEQDGFLGRTDFSDEDVFAMIDSMEDAVVEFRRDDNGDSYVHVTATGDMPYIGGEKLPVSLNADDVHYIAFHYRTTAPAAKWIGISYHSLTLSDDADNYLVDNYDDFICDGQWHTTVLDCTGAPNWNAFITNLRIWLFADAAENPDGSEIDIMWMKYYRDEPFFEDAEPATDPSATDAPATEGDTAVEPATEETPTDAAPADTGADTAAGGESAADTAAAASEGCKSLLTGGLTLVLTGVCAAALTLARKKRHPMNDRG